MNLTVQNELEKSSGLNEKLGFQHGTPLPAFRLSSLFVQNQITGWDRTIAVRFPIRERDDYLLQNIQHRVSGSRSLLFNGYSRCLTMDKSAGA